MFNRQSFIRHSGDRLSAYCQGELPAAEARQLGQHLESCENCRQEYEEIRLGIALAENLAAVPAPTALWAGIERVLDKKGPAVSPFGVTGWLTRRAAFAAAAIVLLMATLVWYTQLRAPVRLIVAAADPSSLERAALEQHRALNSGSERLEYVSTTPGDLRRWIRQQSGLSAGLANLQGTPDAARFQPVGARIIRVNGVQAAVVAYLVDANHVTIVTARLSDLKDAPGVGWFSKNVSYRDLPAQDLKVLTWGSGGQAYVMVSGLAGFGQQSCFICHADEEHRQKIRNAKPERSSRWEYGVRP
ncbi:MAG: anti-sigma factor family protein [Terriglobales bacterium]